MKPTLTAAVLLFLSFSASRAQEVDVYFGLGSAHDSSNGQQIDTFSDKTLHATPGMSGVFTDFGVNFFFNKQMGVGWTGSWKWSSADYAGLSYQSNFHTFDAIIQPSRLTTKRVTPEFRAGIGVATVHIDFDDQQACNQVPGCPSSHFFLAHLGGGARVYVSDHIFLRPAIDVHYVNSFFPFGSNWVPRYSMSVGYSFGKE